MTDNGIDPEGMDPSDRIKEYIIYREDETGTYLYQVK